MRIIMKNREIVRGTKDFLPREAELKRNFESRSVQTFLEWGYQEVITPTFEYLEVIESGAGEDIREELFLFQDRDGRILALRPEMTIPIARIAATKLRDQSGPIRLFYNANIFRHTLPQMGRYKEFYQLGVELIGAPGRRADAEVIALAAEILEQQNMEFKISLNHIGIFNSLLAASGLDEAAKESVKDLMLNKDLVGLRKVLQTEQQASELTAILLELPVMHGGPQVLDGLAAVIGVPGVNQAVEELLAVYQLLEEYGIQQDVVIDLGILRGFDYYTGLVFEGYSPQLGYPLLGGGRYDNLLDKLGCPRVATGFAVGIERVLLALKDRDTSSPERYVVSGKELGEVLAKARELRKLGKFVEVETDEVSPPDGVVVKPSPWSW